MNSLPSDFEQLSESLRDRANNLDAPDGAQSLSELDLQQLDSDLAELHSTLLTQPPLLMAAIDTLRQQLAEVRKRE